MRFKVICLTTLLSLGIVVSLPVNAQGLDVGEGIRLLKLGVRGGFSAIDKREDFIQAEAFATYGLPWSWQLPAGFYLDTRLEASVGALDGGGRTGIIGIVGPGLALGKTDYPVALNLGVSFVGLSNQRFGRQNFGSQFQFLSHIGISYQFVRHWEVGYRFQHMSNAGISNKNPGLEMHMFELSYRF